MAVHTWIFFTLCIIQIRSIIAESCSLQPILQGANVGQNLGSSRKKVLINEPDCKAKCLAETEFKCSAILWPGKTGDCYLMDTVDLTGELFRDNREFILYTSVCPGQQTPSVGYCQFIMVQAAVTKTSNQPTQSPGMTTETSCTEFCISQYRGRPCQAFIVSEERVSTCTLYETTPSGLEAGTQRLWNKTCSGPPQNCIYSEWNSWDTCTASCGGGTWTHTRKIVSQASTNGVPCMDSELTETLACNTQPCGVKDADCVYADWTAWGTCSAPGNCGPGVQLRWRDVATEAAGSGKACATADQQESKVCDSGVACAPSCIYSAWSAWTTCGANCMQTRSRTLDMGDQTICEAEYGALQIEQVCEGGQCGAVTSPPNNNNGSSGNQPTTPRGPPGAEEGCKIERVDAASRPSSKGFKAVGAQYDCAKRCKEETAFQCEAYTTTGSNGPCLLHGAIDRQIQTVDGGKYYLQDIKCSSNKSPSTAVCSWKKTGTVPSPADMSATSYKGVGFTINAPHCGTLCMMNHPMFKPNPCKAYAFNPAIDFVLLKDNCYFFEPPVNVTANGPGMDVYEMVC